MPENDVLEKDIQEQMLRSKRELNLLYEISTAMRTTLELKHILYIILTGVTSHVGLGFNRAILFLVNQKEGCFEPQMAIGPESGEHAKEIWEYIENSHQHLEDLIREDITTRNIENSSLYHLIKQFKIPLEPLGTNLLSQAFYKGSPMHITQDLIDQYQNDPLLKIFKTIELIIMPLKAKDKINGLIIADNIFTQKNITEEDLRIFTMLANQAGLAIENSQLYEMIKQKSDTDSLTNLWNHGHFQNKLQEEIKNHQASNEHLSLLMIDIDNFKKLNDSYGHQKGDLILKEIAKILKNSLRSKDYLCRYGGEEFTILLPHTTKEQAFLIAENLRKKIPEIPFNNLVNETNLSISISIGLAAFPTDSQNKEDLIAKADKAMYVAKFSGKNQTCAAE